MSASLQTTNSTIETLEEVTNDPSSLLALLLHERGLYQQQEIEHFLNPDYKRDLHDPWQLHEMEAAVERIVHALENTERIVIYADYDADGIPGSVIFNDFFTKLGCENFEVYLPHRHEEGYGLHTEAIDVFAKNNVDLIITVDVGITATDAVQYAKDNGIDVIVTDHHEPASKIPQADAIVNPKLGEYPDRMICGATVAWKVVSAALEQVRKNETFTTDAIQEGWEKWLLDMVGIATLSDMVPLVGENRVLASYGLLVLRKSLRPGLVTLFQKLRINRQKLTEDDITFMLTPRLNAASRMAHPDEAFKLLVATELAEAQTMTEYLIKLNDERKQLVAKIMKEAKTKLQERNVGSVLVVGKPEWSVGVLGLVAGKLSEEYQIPTFVWSKEGETIKGSCRAPDGCDLVQLMRSAVDGVFIEAGGHAGAGGFSVSLDAIHTLEESLEEAYKSLPKNTENSDTLSYDAKLPLEAVTKETFDTIQQLSPFGVANPKPVFCFENVTVTTISYFGKNNDHLRITVTNGRGENRDAIAFYKQNDSWQTTLDEGKHITLLAELDYSEFRGRPEMRLRIVDAIQ